MFSFIQLVLFFLIYVYSSVGFIVLKNGFDNRNGLRTNQTKKIRILHTTDIHGWVKGHDHSLDTHTDFGDFRSLLDHLEIDAKNNDADILLFDSGDQVEGTGLSDATSIHGKYILQIIESIPYTALTVGNHDAGRESTVDYYRNHFVSHLPKKTCVTTNIFWKQTGDYFCDPFKLKVTERNGLNVLIFGMIYNFLQAASTVHVLPVEIAIKLPAFENMLKMENLDMIVIPMHIAPDQDEINVIYKAIRAVHPTIPLIFLAGHSHTINYKQFDANCHLYQSNHYFLHLGVIDLEIDENGQIGTIQHQFLPATMENFYQISKTNNETFSTPAGLKLKREINKDYSELNLDELYGCASKTYKTIGSVSASDSFYGLYFTKIMQEYVYNKYPTKNKRIYISSHGFLRDDIYEGRVEKNDVISIMPFDDPYNIITSVPGSDVLGVIHTVESVLTDAMYVSLFSRYFSEDELEDPVITLSAKERFIYDDIKILTTEKYDIISSEYDAVQIQGLLGYKYQAKKYATGTLPRDIIGSYIRKHYKC